MVSMDILLKMKNECFNININVKYLNNKTVWMINF